MNQQTHESTIRQALERACPTSLAAGQIPRETVLTILAPLVEAVAELRARVDLLEARRG